MTFTYDGENLSTPLARVRMEIGDTEHAAPLFSDEEAQRKLDDRGGNELLAAADLCGILARKFARDYDVDMDGQSLKRSQVADRYAKLEGELRERASGGVSVLTFTRIDGHSQDVASRDVGTSRTGRVRSGYTDPDNPF